MPAPNYAAIKEAVKTLIDNASPAITPAPRVVIEDSVFMATPDTTAMIGVYMTGRSGALGQPLAAGQRARYRVDLVLWILFFSMESLKHAIDSRDTLVGSVEQVLMRDRTLGGAVATSWQEGGEMFSARDAAPFPFVAGAEIKLVCEINFTST